MGTAIKVSVALVMLAGAGASLATGANLPACAVGGACVSADGVTAPVDGQRGAEVTSLLLLGGGLAFASALVRRPRPQA
jgi:hypothetical protein